MNALIKIETIFFAFVILLLGCTGENSKQEASDTNKSDSVFASRITVYPEKEVFWGNTHLHTSLSGDAFGAGTRLGAEEAYRLAIGEELQSNTGQTVKLERPLDFLAITDHAEGFGVFDEISAGNEVLMADPIAKRWHDLLQGGKEEAQQLAVEIPSALANNKLPEPVTNPAKAVPILRSAWYKFTAVTEKYNTPGKFTTFQAYEWTSVPTGNNLHRNVIFRDGKERVDSILPFSALQSEDPEKLWAFLTNYEQKTGGKALAIPHNGNLSGGLMFSPNDFEGKPIDAAYASERAKWEPLYEIMQIKGVGETHPMLSPNDEFAAYGLEGWDNGNLTLDILIDDKQMQSQFARKALQDGMKHEESLGTNPFKVGFVGATDAHTSITSVDEDKWWGKHTTSEPSAERVSETTKKNNGVTRYGWHYLSGGYTAVWAESNTREAIWDAMKSKEAYATTGTRIKLRVFGSFSLNEEDIKADDYLKRCYSKGVPMGGDLHKAAPDQAPHFFIHAVKDPKWANLDRVQVIKCWVENGIAKEKIYDVAWSGDRKPDNKGKLPSVGNTVDLSNASYTNDIGSAELKTLWTDPDFNPALRACYYVRVLEIPSPTWILYDKVKYNLTNVPKKAPLVHQERAWSSPIWYNPTEAKLN